MNMVYAFPQPGPSVKERSTVEAAHMKRQLIPQKAPRKSRAHDPGEAEVPQVHRQAPEDEDRFALYKGADKDSRVSVADNDILKCQSVTPSRPRDKNLSGKPPCQYSIMAGKTGRGAAARAFLAALPVILAPGTAEAAPFSARGWVLPILGASLILIAALTLVLTLLIRRRKPLLGFFGSVFRSVGQAISENPDVKKLVERHPRFFSFLGRRLDRESFSGLPATLLGAAFLFLLIQFLGVVESILTLDPIVAADLRTANLLASLRTEGLNHFFLMVTLLGKWTSVLAFALAASGILLLWKRWVLLPGLWVCIIGSTASTWLGKVVFHRQRPAVAEYVEWSYSFPSGHSVISVALYGFFVYLVWRFSNRWRQRLAALVAGSAVILGIGTSRLYLGVHYLSDVWGGYLVGLMWLIVGVSLAEAAAWKWPPPEVTQEDQANRAASWILAGAAVGAYLLVGSVYNPPPKTATEKPPQVVKQNVESIFLENRLPRYTETLTGKNQEPLSFVIAAPGDRMFVDLFQRAGWTLASQESLGALVKAGRAALADRPDSSAPMTPSFWSGRPHDFGFEKPLKKATVRERHHARFWKTAFKTPEGLLLYVGTASLDIGLKWGVAHRIQANIDAEREFLFSDLVATGSLKNFGKTDFVEPLFGQNFIGDPFFTDGKIYILTLREGKRQPSGR